MASGKIILIVLSIEFYSANCVTKVSFQTQVTSLSIIACHVNLIKVND